MLLHHGVVDFPECIGQLVHCGGCKEVFHLDQLISISYLVRINETQAQVHMALLCLSCVTISSKPEGSC